MGRPVRSGADNLPRVLAGLLVPIAGILLLTFYFSNRPAEPAQTGQASDPGGGAAEASADSGPTVPERGESPASGVEPADTPVVSPTLAPEPTEEPTPAPPATVTPTSGVRGTVNADEGLNVRSGPSTNFGVVRVAPFGEVVELTGESTSEGELLWVELVGDGWVQDQYLDFE